MNTLEQVLEQALQLPDEQQEMLIQLLKHRHRESRRAEIAIAAQQGLADFRAGKLPRQSAEAVITDLRQSLCEPDA